MSAWARLPVVLLATLVLAACSNGGGNGSGGNPPPSAVLEEIRLEPADAALAAGLTLQYSAIGLYSDGSEQDLTNSVSWQSAGADVALIDTGGLARALAPGLTTILASESGIEGDTPLTVTDAEVVTVGIFPPAAQLKKGTTQDYRAFAVYSDGGIENVTFSANWSLQNDSGILAPYEPLLTRGLNSLDDFATAIAVDVGDDVVVASVAADTSDEQQGTSAINVTESELLTLRISPRSETVLVGGSIRYQATGLYADGRASDLTKVVQWASADPAIISISNAAGERGLAIAQAAGETEVSATYLEIGDSTAVQVLDFGGANPIEKIDVFPPLQSLNVGALQQYTAVAYLADGRSVDITQDAHWSSADETVAIISNSLETTGLVLAAGVGDTTILARFQDSGGDAALEVRAADDSELMEIIVEPLQSTLQSFTSAQFTAIGIYEDGSKRDITGQVAWGSRDNSVIQVSNSANFGRGLALALSPGVTEVTAVQKNDGSPVEGEAPVTVIEAENIPAQLLVNPPAARAIVGDNQQYTATLVLDSGISEDVTDTVAWSSSDTAVAQIDDSGLASAESAGTTGINATLLIAGNPLSGSAILTVDGDVGIEEILVDPPLSEIIVGDTQAYTAWAVLTDGTTVDITDAVSWSSSDSDVAQIRLDGVALGLAAGTTQIQALLEFEGENFSGAAQLTVKPEGNTVRSLAISPLYSKLLVGGKQQYRAEAILTDGSRVDVTEEVTWSVADQTVAMITSGGLVQGESAGRTDIGAVLVLSYGTVNGRAILDVVEPGIVSMEVLPTKASAVEGSSRQYSAIATLTDGSTLDVSEQAFWIALDGSVARVDQSGLAFALSEGETGVFAALEYQDQRFEGTAEFTVKASDIELSSLVVSPVSAEVLIGGTQQYSAIAYYDDGSSQDVTTISDWSTASSRVAQVDRVGLATGLFPGDTFVVARYSFRGSTEVDSGKLRVRLPPDAISDIVLSPPDGDILVGDQLQYSAQMVFANGDSVDITDLSTWESSDTEVASVGPSTGLAAGLAAGKTSISASIVLHGQSYQGDADLSVNAQPQDIVELIVSPATANIFVDATQQYQAWVVLSDGATEDVSGLVSWQSSSVNVAWIDSDGLATGVSAGVVEIAATLLVDGESYSDAGQLVVEPIDTPITGIVVAPADAKILQDGTRQYTATAILADGSQQDVTDLSIWESADTAIAKIDASALAIGLAAGLTEITATFIHASETYSDSAALEVLAPPLEIDDLVVSPAAAEVLIGSSENYTATALLSDGSSVDVTDDVSWTSSDAGVAHVDELGLATGLDEGSADITATLNYNDEIFSDSGVLTVAPPIVGIDEILVTPVARALLVGESLQYTATAILTNGSSEDVTEESDWSSSDSSVAIIDDTALANAIAPGPTKIIATFQYQGETYQGGATLEVKAQDVGIESLVVDPPVASILVDTTQAYSAYVLLTDGSSHDVTDSTDWASGSPEVAAIDKDGIALGLSEGQAKITGTFVYKDVVYQDGATLAVEDDGGGIIDKLIVEPANAAMLTGGTQQYSATALFDDGSKQDVTDDAVWTSTDRDVAEISQDALATGISLGDAGIVATLLYNGKTVTGDAALEVIGDTVSVVEIVVDPPAAVVVVDSQAQYTATAILSDGKQIPVTDDVLWTSLDSGIAQVDIAGLATGLVAGETDIVATLVMPSGSFSDSGHITVKPAEATLEQLVVTPTTATVLIEGQQQYTATAKLSDGSSIDVTAVASWSSSAENIAHVSLVGLATGLAEGSSKIGAEFTLWGVSASDSGLLEVEAADIGISKLVVEPTTSSILIGGKQAYTAEAVLSNGDLVDVTDRVSWTSADEAIARISTAGIATGTGEGDVEIVASLNYQDDLYKGQAALQVKAPTITVDELVVTPQYVELFNEEQQQYNATAILSDDSEIPVTDDVTWSSGNNDIAQVNPSGLAIALSEGATQITATLVYSGGIISNSGDMQVTGRLAERLQIIPPYVKGPDGTKGPLIVLAAFSDGTVENVTAGAAWSTSEPTIVTVVSKSGEKVARYQLESPGEAEITAVFDGMKSVIPVIVNAAELVSITVSPSSVSTPVGLEAEFTATGFYSNGDTATLTDEVTWTSSDTSVSQFTKLAGVAVAVGVGTAKITAALDGVEGTAKHLVTSAQPVELIITPPLWSDPAGTSHAFVARVIYTDGSDADVTQEASWFSTDHFVASVGNKGELTGVVDLNNPGGATITASLGSVADSAPVIVTDPVVVQVLVEPFNETYPERFKVKFRATAIYSNGDNPDVTDEAFWHSQEPATAVAGLGGEVYTISPGSTLIEASYGGVIGDAPINVVTATVVNLQITPGVVIAPKGTQLQLQATAFYDNNHTELVTEYSVWKSANETVATVIAEGEEAGGLALVGVGGTSVQATYQGVSNSISVTVDDAVLEEIIVQPQDATVALGLAQQYQAIGVYSDSSAAPLEKGVVWTSSDKKIASIDAAGEAQTLAVGLTTIAASSGGILGSTTLSVSDAVVLALTIDPAVDVQPAGVDTPLTVKALLSDGHSEDVTTITRWEIVQGGGASVTQGLGILHHNTVGSTVFQATLPEFADPNGNETLLLAFTTAAVLESIELTPDPMKVQLGVPQSFLATGYYSDGSNAQLNFEADWTVTDTDIATVSELGEVNGVMEGSTTVTAAVGLIGDTATVNVEAAPLQSIQVSPADVVGPQGSTEQLLATGYYADGSHQDVTALALWQSTDKAVAEVGSGPDVGGELRLLAVGTTTVTASLKAINSNNAEVEVTDAQLLAIEVEPATAQVPAGTTQQYVAIGIYTDGERPLDKNNGLLWNSFPPWAATIDEDGVATAIGLFSKRAAIFARVKGAEGVVGQAELLVTEAEIVGLQVTPGNVMEATGNSVQLTATAYYSDGSDPDVTQAATWESSNTAVASVVPGGTEAGLVTLRAPGDAVITASFDGETAHSNIQVTEATLVSINVDPPLAEIPAGLLLQYQATGVYSDGSTSPLSDVTWESSETAVATITPAGLAHALGEGVTTISASAEGITGSGELEVTAAQVLSIEVSAHKAVLFEREEQQYLATAIFSDGHKSDVTDAVFWDTDPNRMAQISNSANGAGMLRALNEEQGEVIATLRRQLARSGINESISGSKDLTVLAVGVIEIEIDDAGQDTLLPGLSADWTAQGLLSNGDETDVTTTANWVSSDPTLVTVEVVEGAARLTAVFQVAQPQAVEITASLDRASDTHTVTVLPLEIVDVQIFPLDPEVMPVGTTQNFYAQALLNNGDVIQVTQDVDWLATNTSPGDTVAQFEEDFKGRALALSEGWSQVSVFLPGGSSYDGPVLQVEEKQPEGLVVVPAEVDMPKKSKYPFLALVIYTDGSSADVTEQTGLIWSSDNEAAVKISNTEPQEGVAEAKNDNGEATITAEWQDQNLSAYALVTTSFECHGDPSVIVVTPDPIIIGVGESVKMMGTGTWSDGCTQSTTTGKDAHWHVAKDDEDVADVVHREKDGRAGLLTGLAVGVATVDNSWDNKVYGYAAVIVAEDPDLVSICQSPAALGTPTAITIVPSEGKLKEDSTLPYRALGYWSGENCYAYIENDPQLEWSSDDADTCSVDAQGLVTANGKDKDKTRINAIYDEDENLSDDAECEVKKK